MNSDTYRDRVLGSLLGGAIGDALGAPVEFWSREQIVATLGPQGVREYLETSFGNVHGRGLITDDTQMTLFTMEGLIAAYARSKARGIGFVMALVLQAYLRWYQTQISTKIVESRTGWLSREAWLYSRRAPGNTCLAALQRATDLQSTSHGILDTQADNNSKGCGAVMRTAPLGWIPCDRQDLDAWIIPSALEVAGFTHGHKTGQVSAVALTLIIYELMNGADLQTSVEASIEQITPLNGSQETTTALQRAMFQAAASPRSAETLESLGGGWIGEEALAIAVYSALSYPNPESILDALSLAVSHSGDSDSTGAICGNILGALHGVHALPQALLNDLEGLSTIRKLGKEFIQEFT